MPELPCGEERMGGGTHKLLPKKSQLRSPAPSSVSQAGLGTRPCLCGSERTHPKGLLRAAGIARPPSVPRAASPAALPPSSQKRRLGVGEAKAKLAQAALEGLADSVASPGLA